MMSIDKAKQWLKTLEGKSNFEKMIEVTAILTKLLENDRIKPIIVGGFAVEIYTRSEYSTVDIDLVLTRRDLADAVLKKLGFQREGRHWYHEQLMVAVEIPNDVLEDADVDKVVELSLGEGKRVYVIGIEDIILDRLRACVHWQSSSDCEWGRRLFLLHFSRLDMDYMKKTAKTDLTLDRLNEWIVEQQKLEDIEK